MPAERRSAPAAASAPRPAAEPAGAGATPVTVAVVSTNARDKLASCLRALEPEVDAGRAAVWVVDNASSDGSAQMVEEAFPWANLVPSSRNLGFPQAVNLVADRTDSAWLAPANEDTELTPGALEALLESGARHPRAGVIAPRLVLPDGSTQHSVWPFPTLGFTLLFNLGLHRLSRRLAERLCLEGYWDPDRPREVDWAMAAFVLVRREAFRAIGGFDRRMWMYADDLDLGWRLGRAGWSTRYEPRAVVRHADSAATRRTFGDDRTERWMGATYAWMVGEWGLLRTWLIAAINVAGAAARVAALSPLARRRPERWWGARELSRRWLRAHLTGLRGRRTLVDRR